MKRPLVFSLAAAAALGGWAVGYLQNTSASKAVARAVAASEQGASFGMKTATPAGSTSEQDKAVNEKLRAEQAWMFDSSGRPNVQARIERAARTGGEIGMIVALIRATADLDEQGVQEFIAASQSLDRERQTFSIFAAVSRWAELNPKAAAEYAAKQKRHGNMGDMIREGGSAAALGHWGAENPDEALAWLKEQNFGDDQVKMLGALCSGMLGSNPERAFSLLAERSGDNRYDSQYAELIAGYAALDPLAAARRAVSQEDEKLRGRAIDTTARVWASRDGQAALAWAYSLGNEREKYSAMRDVLRSWAQRDADAAAQQLLMLAPDSPARNVADDIAEAMAARDLKQAQDFAGKLSGESQVEAMGAVAKVMVEEDPAKARDYINKIGQGRPREQSIEMAADRSANRGQFAETAEWLGQLGESDGRKEGAKDLVSKWADKDLNKSAAWISSLPEGNTRDAAADAYSGKVLSKDPQAAMDWALSISDEKSRAAVVSNRWKKWHETSAKAAETWAAQTPQLTEEQRAALLSTRKK